MAQQHQQQKPSLVWIDCEMTGLLSTDKLIEIAVIITDDDLNIVAEGPNLIIHQPKEVMDNMNQCVHADKVFLEREMAPIIEHLHYRIVDVSTVKELARRWFPSEFEQVPKKKEAHRALDDIKESIGELKYYRSSVFK
ncbi:Oligoribonuclease, mitochondrial [Linnemannia gamsii]|uniref:Oligoribonuclease, mitochondrial n=1 Tax=Linnemannia gamsii TaxID=64522 RepID=A0A9P6RBC9_9FUNG|nr:Oligoribonuclease, mitochondrial [Linnemannia gamsii]